MITLIWGPMWGGKTSEMFRLIRRHKVAEQRVVIYKYAKDTRYSELACSHDGVTHDAISVSTFDGKDVPQNVHAIGIDEGQFISGVADFAERCANAGIYVYISALNSTFERNPFDNIMPLAAKAERIITLTAVCHSCKKDAHFTKRLSDSKELEVIGGKDDYVAVCRKCYFA
jgi:thymidine kinase